MKRYLILAVFMIASIDSYCQILKIQGGPTVSKLYWNYKTLDHTYFEDPILGYSIFAGFDYAQAEFINLSTNFGIIRKGGKEEVIIKDAFGNYLSTENHFARMDFLSLNTLVEFNFPVDEVVFPFLSAGPRFDYLLNSEIELFDSDGFEGETVWGILLGGGLKFDLEEFQLGLRADYYQNLTKIVDSPAGPYGAGLEVTDRTWAFSLSLGYKMQ